ncbi:MAG: methyltransferase domain-containing protein [Myxococcales bacterium]|nr:methyltransferase domain-containing protein [Myxococcales bacterium]
MLETSPITEAAERSETRRIHRVPVRLVVSHAGRSAVLGETRDLSQYGFFLATSDPLPTGSVLPISLELGGSPPVELQLRAEVVRRTDDGMGLAFIDPPKDVQKRLRHFVADMTSVEGTRRTVEQLHDPATSTIEPITDPARVAQILARTQRERVDITLIPAARTVRDRARLAEIGADRLVLRVPERSQLEVGEDVFALVTLDFVSYSFQARVLAADGERLELSAVTSLVYSERRGRTRERVRPGTVVRWPLPWDASRHQEFPVVEMSDNGLSFRADEATCQLMPGMALDGARVGSRGEFEPLRSAEVRHITRVIDEDGAVWLRVGLQHGTQRGATHVEEAEAVEKAGAKGPLGRLGDALGKVGTAVAYLFHKSKNKIAQKRGGEEALPFVKVKIKRPDGMRLVGILDRAFGDEGVARCPLVIVVPGFAGRKEQMSFLASTLVEGFRRNHQDIAVLRVDGTNNLGESDKDPGCEGEGRNTLHYTVGGVVKDTLACLAWARQNPYVDPTHVVIVSLSFGAVGAMHAMTLPEASAVGLWVSYMGAPEVRDAVKHVSGHFDIFENHRIGRAQGLITMAGCVVDGDNFWADMSALGIGQLDDSKREMAKIRADIHWFLGLHDAWMDPRRVREVMNARPENDQSQRDIIEVDGGHLPRSGEEAMRQFTAVTRRVWQHVHHSPLEPFRLSLAKLGATADLEWSQVRRNGLGDPRGWWRRYLLGEAGMGFDILEYTPEYDQLMETQADLLDVAGKDVLEIGAGTGNLSRRVAERGPRRQVVTDLVPEALERIRTKLPAGSRAELRRVDVEGTPLVAVHRLTAGDLPGGARALVERVPGVHRATFERVLETRHDGAVHAAILGRAVDPGAIARERALPDNAARLLGDLHALASAVPARRRGEEPELPELHTLSRETVLGAGRGGLPYADGSFDRVAMSLVLSYLDEPDDVLFEAYRVLRPGGLFLVSSLIRDADSSKLFLDMVERVEQMPEADLPGGQPREVLIESLRDFLAHASELMRLEEEGVFKFYDGDELVAALARRGFDSPRVVTSFGDPAQAVIVVCRRP